MDKREVIKIVKNYSDLVNLNIKNVKYVVLFGSYSKGKPNKHSDIDVAVVVSETNKNMLEIEGQLYKLRRSINSKIEPVLIDENKDPAMFLNEIMKTGKIIFKKIA